jgi:hypothetical protein
MTLCLSGKTALFLPGSITLLIPLAPNIFLPPLRPLVAMWSVAQLHELPAGLGFRHDLERLL